MFYQILINKSNIIILKIRFNLAKRGHMGYKNVLFEFNNFFDLIDAHIFEFTAQQICTTLFCSHLECISLYDGRY